MHPGRSFNGGRGGGNGHGGSGGYDRRTRPNAQKNLEKYLNLAKDALSEGDIVQAENWYQHADHYQRVLNACDEQERAMAPAPRAEAEAYEQPQVQQPRGGYDDDMPAYAQVGSEPRQPQPQQRYQQQPGFGSDEEAGRGQPALQQPRSQPRMRPQHQRRRPVDDDVEQSLNVPFLMNAPQPVIKAQPVAAPAPASVPVPAEAAVAGTEDAPAPRRRGRPRKNPDGVAASV